MEMASTVRMRRPPFVKANSPNHFMACNWYGMKAASRSLPQEIKHRGLSQNRLGNAMSVGAPALFRGLRRLQVGAEMASALDDTASDRDTFCIELPQRWNDRPCFQRCCQRSRVVSRLRHARGHMRACNECRIADDCDSAERHSRRF